MIGELLPPAVASCEAFADLPGVELYPEEQRQAERMGQGRRQEFSTGRACARAALASLGRAPAAIPAGPRGAPAWPQGTVGSITHCAGYRAAVVADSREFRTLGVDAEPDLPLPPRVLERITGSEERAAVESLTARLPHVSWDRLLFCAKETIYKAWFPLTHQWLDFREAEVYFSPADGSFAARLLVPARVSGFQGRWAAGDGLVLTVIAERQTA